MKPNTFNLVLSDNTEYVFTERRREDTNPLVFHELVRRQNLRTIQDEIKNSDERVTLLISEMRRTYTNDEVNAFINSNPDALFKVCYDSFKIQNALISFERFKELLSSHDVRVVAELVKQNDFPEEGEKKKKKKATPSQKK